MKFYFRGFCIASKGTKVKLQKGEMQSGPDIFHKMHWEFLFGFTPFLFIFMSFGSDLSFSFGGECEH